MGAVNRCTGRTPFWPVLIAALAAVAPTAASGQAAAPSALKAAFLFNFAKFTEWPALPAQAPVRVCVAGDDTMAGALEETVRGQTIQSHGIQAVPLPGEESARACQVLFVSAADAKRAAALVSDIAAGPVLTVSDLERFTERGGMVELFVESGRMKFAINVDAVQRARIRLSSRLLGLARIVRTPGGS
jgi:hypothetical protein